MSKMDNAMQVILFEDENTLNQPVTFDNNHQTTVMHDNNNPQVINQNTQLNNNKPISFSLNIHQSTFERTQNFYIDRLNLTDLIGNITSNNNNTNTNNTNIVMNNNINICIS
jgi:hypothetical protein